VSSLALPAYLASAARFSLQNEILSRCAGSEILTCRHAWSDSFGDLPEALPAKQSVCMGAWDRPGIAADRALVELTLTLSNLPRFEPHRRHTVEMAVCAAHNPVCMWPLSIDTVQQRNVLLSSKSSNIQVWNRGVARGGGAGA